MKFHALCVVLLVMAIGSGKESMAEDTTSPPEPITKSRQPSAPDADEDYWTLERMREAQPMELPHPDQPPPGPSEANEQAPETGPSTGGADAAPDDSDPLRDEQLGRD